MTLRLLLVLWLFTASMQASAAPIAVEVAFEIRGSAAVGPFRYSVPNLTAEFSDLQPDGSFRLENFRPITPVFSTAFPFNKLFRLEVDDPAIRISGDGSLATGTFAPQPGGGFGGSVPFTVGANLFFFVSDRVGNRGWQNTDAQPIFGVSGTFRFLDAYFVDARGPVGPWTTGTVTLSGSHDAVGTFVTRLNGGDTRTPGGLGLVWMVSPVFIQELGDFPFNTPGSQLPLFAVLSVNFVPEPAGAALLALGIGSLALARRISRS